jgi:hypothetical protein
VPSAPLVATLLEYVLLTAFVAHIPLVFPGYALSRRCSLCLMYPHVLLGLAMLVFPWLTRSLPLRRAYFSTLVSAQTQIT